MKLDSEDLAILDYFEEITLTDYEIKRYPATNEGYINHDNWKALMKDLRIEIDTRDEKIEDLKNDNQEESYYDEERSREKTILGL